MTVNRICKKHFRSEFREFEKILHVWSGLRAPLDGRTDGRACRDIVLSRHDLKTYFEKYFREFEKILHVHVWSGLGAPLDGRTRGRTDGRTDGRTCNDIVLSRHDCKKSL